MTNPLAGSSLLTPLISSAAVRAIIDDLARLQRMLDFEAALARAQAAVGVIPALASEHIAHAARAERFDVKALGEEATASGSIAIPVVQALAAEVAKADATAATYVHWGAASQDVIDTALVLELRAVIDALIADLDRAIDGFADLAGRHRRTATAGRTQLQHSVPMPFGLKLAGYAAALARSRERLRRLRRESLVLQFGGEVGTLAALHERGLDVAGRLAALLDLPLPEAPWHSHRDRLAEIASALSILTGTCGKIGRDISLLMQTDVGEASEPAVTGRGAPGLMARKRNPRAAATALAAATIAPNLTATILAMQVQEHERALGGWQTEWQTFPALSLVTSAALQAIVEIAEGLEIDTERMRTNLAASRGRIMAEAASFALAAKLGKPEAVAIVEEAIRKSVVTKRELQDVLGDDDRVKRCFSIGELAKLFEPMAYQGVAQNLIERIVVSLQERGAKR
jgi:3-carboxy-cis,cis-muconate cycloisomerase